MNAAKVLDDLKRRFPNEPEYHQAVEEVLSTIEEEYNKHPEFDKVNLIERLCIPDRVYQFRVTWMDDKGNIQTNMGYRVQHLSLIHICQSTLVFRGSSKKSVSTSINKYTKATRSLSSKIPNSASVWHRQKLI